MHYEHVIKGKCTGPAPSAKKESRFDEADNLFKWVLICILVDNIVEVYMDMPMGKNMWDALKTKFEVYDADSGLYIMEHFYDYKMADDLVE